MPVQPSTQAIVQRFNVATNKIAAKLESCTAALVVAATEAEVNTVLEPIVAALEAIGADPANPLPGEPPIA